MKLLRSLALREGTQGLGEQTRLHFPALRPGQAVRWLLALGPREPSTLTTRMTASAPW